MSTERTSRHFGVMSFTGTGHLNSMILLSQHLKDRGHKVTFIEKPKIESRVRQAGLEFCPIGVALSPFKEKTALVSSPGLRSQLSTLRFNLKRITQDLEMYLQETTIAVKQAKVDALLVNEIALAGPTVAEIARLPYFIISTSVPHSFGWNNLSWLSGFKYSESWFSLVEAAFLENSVLRMRGPIRRTLDAYRLQAKLQPLRRVNKSFPELAHITQLPECLDLPRSKLPGTFHYTGPFANRATRPHVDFPWNRLDGRPIIYASLGTTRNVQPFVFRLVSEACRDLELQLVISLGGRFNPEMFSDLPGNPLVTMYAPQLELLKLATLVITHGGPNTVFETLMEGKPMVAIPLAHDQPAVAARLARLGIAEVLPVMRLSARKIRRGVTKVLNDPSYRDAAAKMQAKLHSLNGLQRAVDVIEEALQEHAAARPDPVAEPHRQVDCIAGLIDRAIEVPGQQWPDRVRNTEVRTWGFPRGSPEFSRVSPESLRQSRVHDKRDQWPFLAEDD
jgi:zeaxanthin glucosyltransferase